MNVKIELSQIISNSKSINQILETIEKDHETDRKIHLLKIAYVSKKIDDKVGTGFFINDRAKFLNIWLNQDNKNRIFYTMIFDLLDKDKRAVSPFINGKYNDKILFFKEIFDQIEEDGKINRSFINLDLIHNSKNILPLETGIGDIFLKLFLNQELNKIYEYNSLQVDLSENKTQQTKKLKI